MNTKDLIQYIEDFEESAGIKYKDVDALRNYLPETYRQQQLIDQINKFTNKHIQGDTYLYHLTSLEFSRSILKDGFLIPKKFQPKDYIENFAVMHMHTTSFLYGGHYENSVMNTCLSGNLIVLEELNNQNPKNYELITEIEKRIHVLNKISQDYEPKIFFHDKPDYVLKWGLASPNYVYDGVVIFCFKKSNVNFKTKKWYVEYGNEDIPHNDYYLNGDEEEYIQEFVKKHALLKSYEFVSYEKLPVKFADFIILLDKFNVRELIKHNGKGKYQVIKKV
ncbi:hypothetical protein [Bacillus litorisediminis]|uniref:hypothetical protein n=1 Tax=Bacillus litorisediminis TaxID=2922713 RepID=UPI001FAF58A3|nr:hypothetical protein [Bacillus litorisediminis]